MATTEQERGAVLARLVWARLMTMRAIDLVPWTRARDPLAAAKMDGYHEAVMELIGFIESHSIKLREETP